MASPAWRVQFYDGAGERRSVYVGAVPKKAADVWLNRIEQLNACVIAGVAPDTDLAAWVAGLPDTSHEKLVQAGLMVRRERFKESVVTIARLNAMFIERSAAKPSTIRGFRQTLDSLTAFFGADCAIDSITAEQSDAWRVWIVKDKEGSGRRKKKRTTGDNRLSPPTVAKRVSVVKQVFRAAVRWGWIPKSPFDGLRPGSQANPARARYTPRFLPRSRCRPATRIATLLRRELRLRRRPHRIARSRTQRQKPLPPLGLQRDLREFRQLPKSARGRMPRKKTAGNGQDGVAGVKWRGQAANNPRVTREIPGARFPATRNATRFRPIAWNCWPGRFVLVAGMAIPEQMRAAVLERVIADVGEHPIQQPEG